MSTSKGPLKFWKNYLVDCDYICIPYTGVFWRPLWFQPAQRGEKSAQQTSSHWIEPEKGLFLLASRDRNSPSHWPPKNGKSDLIGWKAPFIGQQQKKEPKLS